MPFFDGTGQDEKFNGTVGADQIFGRGGDDTLNGKEGVNVIWGGDGDDTIITGLGVDLIYGGDGDDLIRVVKNWITGPYIVAGYGRDSVSLDRAVEGSTISLDYEITYGLDTDDPFDSIEVLVRNDSIAIDKTDSSNDTFRDSVDGLSNLGVDGTILLYGTAGDDEVTVNRTAEGPSIKFFAKGDDTFDGSTESFEALVIGESSFFGDSEFNPFNEIIITNSSNGQMSGRVKMTEADAATSSTTTNTARFTAVDLIEGSTGDDIMTGSSGNDAFRPGYGNDGFDGGRGNDTVFYDAEGIVKTDVDLLYKYGAAVFSNELVDDFAAAAYEFDRFVFQDDIQLDGLKRVENVFGSDHVDDLFRGNNAANILAGGGGDDTLNGRRGNDTLIGGDGDDLLRGFQGNDEFVFDAQDGHDRVFRFKSGEDKLVIVEGFTFSDMQIGDLGTHTLLNFGETEVTLIGLDFTTLLESDFIFLA